MGLLESEIFICIDCETTGLDVRNDKVIEVAAAKFTLSETLDTYENLIDPAVLIPEESIAIHGIKDDMVAGKPSLSSLLPHIFRFIGQYPIVGHGVQFDINLLAYEAERTNIKNKIRKNPVIDTLRLARLYGKSPTNSLEVLRQHFNIQEQGAHRAMNDVTVNIEVFKQLIKRFRTTDDIYQILKKPIDLKAMPLGKHKGRPMKEVPHEYLVWAKNQNFDKDLLYTIRKELKQRKNNSSFNQSNNPFSFL
ncbi:DUF3820 family protein [Simkania negevensis]|uniref:DUF3820 family protein n=1 Tax=Simkania negevensis TaxID=83561 RepID=A0ABS3ARL6_9BACT|nr:DUF3820 family protein [Simkania negevensis]